MEKHSAKIEIYDSKLLTAADRAFNKGHGQIQHFLITNGDNSGITELDRAIIEGDTHLVRSLISAGTSLSTTDNRGSYRIVKRLHDANADLTSLDGKHGTPLFCASELGFDSVIDYLLRQQPESAGIKDDEGRLPIQAAAKNGHRKAVESLMVIDKGAMRKQDRSGSTPLSLAVSVNSVSHTETVKFLIEKGAKIRIND